MEEFVFGTKEAALLPTAPEVVSSAWGGDKYSYKPWLSKILALRPF
jgi:hypothetical protein